MKEPVRHEHFIRRCIELAATGLGHTAPNPMVGSVIVHNNRIIGEGYHKYYGLPHAEVHALQSVTEKNFLRDSVLYVNLEPCSHMGKTPPCADLIISSGIPQVIIGMIDPNPLVAGIGVKRLKAAGIRTTVGVLEEDCVRLNRRFCTHHQKKRPYIILKWAQTKDGYIDMNREDTYPAKPEWISNPVSKLLVHKWRSEEQAILVGTNTALLDNPRLNVREWPGSSPVRMVIDRTLRLPEHLNLFDGSVKTWIFNERTDKEEGHKRYIRLDFSNDVLNQLMDYLYENEIQSVFVEGGKKLIDSLLSKNLWDEARVITGDKSFRSGISAPDIKSSDPEEHRIIDDRLQIYYNF
ncbi:MAG: bifunctional diaminohydroxyphosphoribosylaminopyrimidine deaminase/5-amino-6-(5-phosphoribosylamino)uracil reductase RibD [Bacteroidales bacterium]|nr:bifunctional diaminohydroxyphosphoribosylaminopyrimidine deaminase/5-amino-6-(5-phosphoribosylamino)uracil reductase RibD [Bacteroidales bacterium]